MADVKLFYAAEYAFDHFYHLDKANAAIHCAKVQFSPITFRLAEALAENDDGFRKAFVVEVLSHKGLYEEDRGRG